MSQPNNEPQQSASCVRHTVERRPGLAGHYQIAYNPERNTLFVTGSFNHTKTHGTLCATLARMNACTLETELTAFLPVIEDHNPGQEGLYQIQASYGLALDNPRGLVWTGGTRTQSVTAYSQDDFSLVWDSRSEGIEMLTPRELYVAPDGSVLVTGAGGYQVISVDDRGERVVSPLQDFGPAMLLGPIVDEERALLYVPNIIKDEIWVIDIKTWERVDVFPVHGGQDVEAAVMVHGAEIDPVRGELYISAQGAGGKNSGLYILSLEGEQLAYIPFGRMPTDILFNSKRHLLYVADFGGKGEPSIAGGGTITVVAPLTREVVETIQVAPTRINHQVLLSDGSVIAIDKAGDYPAAAVPYVLDARSGRYYEAKNEVRPGEAPNPIMRDGLARVRGAGE